MAEKTRTMESTTMMKQEEEDDEERRREDDWKSLSVLSRWS
jgi:hypothetical protein